MPPIHLLAERPPVWYGSAFEVIPSNEASCLLLVGEEPVKVEKIYLKNRGGSGRR